MALRDATVDATLALPPDGGPIRVESLAIRGVASYPPAAPRTVEIDAHGSIGRRGEAASVEEARLRAGPLIDATMRGRWRRDGSPRVEGDVAASGLGLTAWRDFARPWIGETLDGWTTSGDVALRLEGAIDAAGRLEAKGEATFRNGSFASADGTSALEGLDTDATFAIRREPGDPARLHSTGRAGGFRLLWGTVFADYSSLPSDWTLDAGADGVAQLAWSWPGGPRLEARGRVDENRLEWEARADVDDVTSALDRYLRAPLGDSVPLLTRIEGSGRIRVEAAGHETDGAADLAGRVALDGIHVRGTRGLIEIHGLDLDLPFDLHWTQADGMGREAPNGPDLAGRLRFERLQLAGVEFSGIETALRIHADSLSLQEPMAIPFLGGAAGFERLTALDLSRSTRRVESSLLLAGIELPEVSRAFSLPPLEGRADGYFPRVQLTGPTLLVDGGGEIALFGGRLAFGAIEGEDMLTRFPKLRFSARFDHIDLERVTRVFDFGAMTGRIQGSVDVCDLYRWTPVRLRGRVETDPATTKNRIDVKAIHNIAILGSGSRIGLLDRGLQRLLDTFTYSRLGITFQLRDDLVELRGLERRGERELFLKGRPPFPVDVVNADPGRTVSLTTLLDRFDAVEIDVRH